MNIHINEVKLLIPIKFVKYFETNVCELNFSYTISVIGMSRLSVHKIQILHLKIAFIIF